jgi:hypothetical protein
MMVIPSAWLDTDIVFAAGKAILAARIMAVLAAIAKGTRTRPQLEHTYTTHKVAASLFEGATRLHVSTVSDGCVFVRYVGL